MRLNPKIISGTWHKGWALDDHTLSSVHYFDDYGHDRWENTRTELGEAIYQLKYKSDRTQLVPLSNSIQMFLRGLKTPDDIPLNELIAAIIPVPPSDIAREFQPVAELALLVGDAMSIPVFADYVLKTRNTQTLKNISDANERATELRGAFSVIDSRFEGKSVILFDDVFRSGSTIGEISTVLNEDGNVARVYALTVTKTRSNR